MNFFKFFSFHSLRNPKFVYFCPVMPRENGLMKKAHFSLYSAIGKLGHFTNIDAGICENGCFLGVLYSYDATSGAIRVPYLHQIKGVQAQPIEMRAKMNGSTLFVCNNRSLFEPLGKNG